MRKSVEHVGGTRFHDMDGHGAGGVALEVTLFLRAPYSGQAHAVFVESRVHQGALHRARGTNSTDDSVRLLFQHGGDIGKGRHRFLP